MPLCRIFNFRGVEVVRFHTDSYSGGHITVGRSSSCDVCLKNMADTSISRTHFHLRCSGDNWSIHDTSRAGLVLDCAKVPSAKLQPGMVLRFGKFFFGFGERAVPSPLRLKWTCPESGIHESRVLWQGKNSVGASNDNYVTVRVGHVARFHSIISVTGESATIENINPMVSTAVNDEQLHGKEVVPIVPGAVITMAGFDVELDRVEPDEELPVTAASFSAPVNPRRMKQERLQALLASLLPLWVALALALLALLAWLGIALMPE